MQTYTRIVFPLALPAIVSGLRVGTGLVVIGVVVTEMLASLGGIGYVISYHRTLFNTGHVYFGIVLALMMAVAVNVGLTWLDRRVGLWRILEQAEARAAMAEWMVGVDTGGTFTDLVAFEPASGELRTIKVPSVPADPSTRGDQRARRAVPHRRRAGRGRLSRARDDGRHQRGARIGRRARRAC